MPTTGPNTRARLNAWLDENRPERITELDWARLLEALAPIPERRLRQLLRASGRPLTPLVEGVRQDNFAELERTLLALEAEYRKAVETADRSRARAARRMVIDSKGHARLAARNPRTTPPKRAEKEEMALWMLTWLENPAVFPAWVKMRKSYLISIDWTVN